MIRNAQDRDAAGIAGIYNAAVRETTAIWNEIEVDAADRRGWIARHLERGFPVLVAEEDGRVAGYATYGPFRDFDGYRATAEHSVYVHGDFRGRGLGFALMEALLAEARARGVHVMVAAIEAGNAPSIALHEKLGFEKVGLMPEVGQKFGRWLDLALLQLRLDARPKP